MFSVRFSDFMSSPAVCFSAVNFSKLSDALMFASFVPHSCFRADDLIRRSGCSPLDVRDRPLEPWLQLGRASSRGSSEICTVRRLKARFPLGVCEDVEVIERIENEKLRDFNVTSETV